MKCCLNCFSDIQIRNWIQRVGEDGCCDVSIRHRAQLTKTIDLDLLERDASYMEGFQSEFIEIFDLYIPSESHHIHHAQKLSAQLRDHWGIFNLETNELEVLLKYLAPTYFRDNPTMLQGLVIPLHVTSEEYQLELGIFSGKSWAEFENIIRHENRYHSGIMVTKNLTYFLQFLVISIAADETYYYRARKISEVDLPQLDIHDIATIGPAPVAKAGAGRLNAPGFSYLYLGSDETTSLVEIKTAIRDLVAIGTFKVTTPIQVVDLDGLVELSPFGGVDKMAYLVNRPILLDIDKAMRSPSGRNRSEVDYVPTQFISDLIKTMGVDGMRYASSVDPSAFDLVLFRTDKISLAGNIKIYEIDQLTPHRKPVDTKYLS